MHRRAGRTVVRRQDAGKITAPFPAAACCGAVQDFVELVRNDPRCSPANPLFATSSSPGSAAIRCRACRLNSAHRRANRRGRRRASASTPIRYSPGCWVFRIARSPGCTMPASLPARTGNRTGARRRQTASSQIPSEQGISRILTGKLSASRMVRYAAAAPGDFAAFAADLQQNDSAANRPRAQSLCRSTGRNRRFISVNTAT